MTHRSAERQSHHTDSKAPMPTSVNNYAAYVNDTDMETYANVSKNDGNAQEMSKQSLVTEPTPNAREGRGMKPSKTTKRNDGAKMGDTTARAVRVGAAKLKGGAYPPSSPAYKNMQTNKRQQRVEPAVFLPTTCKKKI